MKRSEHNIRPTLLEAGESDCGRSDRMRVLGEPVWAYVTGALKPGGNVLREKVIGRRLWCAPLVLSM